jgi:predicted MFS family arabinose efflux permease
MVASVGTGALVGAMVMSRYGTFAPPARLMLVASAAWYGALALLAFTTHLAAGIPMLLVVGCAQAMSQVPMAALLLRSTEERYRGRVMGLRMLVIYGNIPGLLLSGPLIARFGYAATATLYCAIGVVLMLVLAACWRAELWRREAPANAR